MDFKKCIECAANGDIAAFSKMYSAVYKRLYYIAYYTLADSSDAIKAVQKATAECFKNVGALENEQALFAYFTRLLCVQIVEQCRFYRDSPQYERNRPMLKTILMRLTDAERLTVMIWSQFGYNTKQLSMVTGLKPEVVAAKLESGTKKLDAMIKLEEL